MYKKRLAMDQSNGYNDDSVESSADPQAADAAAENGKLEKRRRGRKPGEGAGIKKKKKSVILKITRKKVKKPKAEEPSAAPGPDDDGEYEVEAIVDHKKEKGKTLYRVKWKGYPSSEDSWLTANDITCKPMLKKYKKKVERDTKDVYVVSKIIDHRRMKGTTYYRVRWENYSSKDDTWQPKESLSCSELLKQYHESLNETILKREEAKLLAKEQAKKSNNEYEVEAVVGSKTTKGKTKYLIRWKGFEESDDTWEPEETLNCPELIRAFNKKGNKAAKKPAKGKKRKHYSDSENDDSDDSDFGAGKKGKTSGGQYEVEKVLDARINRQNKWEFFVMWKGYGPEHNGWEPESNLNCPKLIDQFLGKDKVPRLIQAKLEKVAVEVATPKKSRKPPSQRSTPNTGGLRGRTKGELKVLGF